MTYVKWTIGLALLAVVVGVFYYALPSRDIVRIVGTEVRLLDQASTDADGNPTTIKDDVYFIKTVEPDGSPRVYRNEDNIWYLKFDSSNLDAEASNFVSTESDPRWVVITHYGWRITYLTMYPNAISMRPATGPDERLFPWLNIAIILGLVIGLLVLRRLFLMMWMRNVDPVVDAIDHEIDQTTSWWRRQFRRRR